MEVDEKEDSNDVENNEGMSAEEQAEDKQKAEEYRSGAKYPFPVRYCGDPQLGVAFFDGAVDA